jgi:hypothetical protein
MKEAPSSSETSVLTRATQRNNPEDTILLPSSDIQRRVVRFSLKIRLLSAVILTGKKATLCGVYLLSGQDDAAAGF